MAEHTRGRMIGRLGERASAIATRGRAGRLAQSRALAAVAAQLGQAVGSFGLQILASRLLGATGLGIYALSYGVIVMGTSLSSGVIGDSLTVLDRHDPKIRSGLQVLAVTLYGVASSLCSLTLWLTGVLSSGAAVVFGLAMAAFMAQETLRRLFMAHMRFWWLLVIDGASTLVALVVLVVAAQFAPLGITAFLTALGLGQVVSVAVAMFSLPLVERYVVHRVPGGVPTVLRFGFWRGAQVTLPTLTQTVLRFVVRSVAGAGALGVIEAARILVAPLQLTANGLAGYLLSAFSKDKSAAPTHLLRRADRAASLMGLGTIAGGFVIVLLAPFVGSLITGTSFEISRTNVGCWVVFAAGGAAVMPYGGLAASQGYPRAVLLARCLDAVVAISAVWALLTVARSGPEWTPAALAVGQGVAILAVRCVVLRRWASAGVPEPLHRSAESISQ